MSVKVKSNVFSDGTNKFDGSQKIQGLVTTWGKDDIVSQINGPVSAEAIVDNSGEILGYRYFSVSFSNIQDRKALVEKDRTGAAIVAAGVVASEITVDLDDERSIGPDYIDNWDAKKLENRIDLKTAKNGEYAVLSKTERAERFFEAMRKAVKASDAATLNDGVTRVVDTTAATEDVAFVKLLQKGGDELVAQKNTRRKGTPREFLFYALTPADLTRVANTQAFTGSNVAGAALAEGAVGKLNGIMVYETINSNGISYCGIRGAAVVPIANPEFVTYPSKSNSVKFAFEYALPKAGSEGILYGDGIVAFGKPADIKA